MESGAENTKPASNYYDDENIDEKITAQEQEIEKQIASEQPLVSQRYDVLILLDEYLESDHLYRNKIKDLCHKFKHIRRTRGDGNCFFRAFAFSYFESIIGKIDEIKKVKELAETFTNNLLGLGYNSFTVSDFKDVFVEELDKLSDSQTTSDSLEASFNQPGASDYIVVFLRLVVSCYLQTNSEFYQAFIENYPTMREFCSHEVEPMYRESDHIHITALTQALNVPVSIIYLDRANQDQVTVHNFPEDCASPSINILYRPGHYDIIYKH